MDGDVYTSISYKLRSAGPAPVGRGELVTQTFGIDKQINRFYSATTTINRSDDMMGITEGGHLSASWQRLPYFDVDGNQLFSGNTVSRPLFCDSDEVTPDGASACETE